MGQRIDGSLTPYLKGDIRCLAASNLAPSCPRGSAEAPGLPFVHFVQPHPARSDGEGTMRKFVYFWAAVLAVNVLMMGVAVGADLPRSGKFTIHSGFKLVGETTQVAEKHTFTYGGGWGVTYNDTGEGPLHLGSVLCSLAMELIDTAG